MMLVLRVRKVRCRTMILCKMDATGMCCNMQPFITIGGRTTVPHTAQIAVDMWFNNRADGVSELARHIFEKMVDTHRVRDEY